MKIRISQFSIILWLFAILLTACSGQITLEPSATIPPTLTKTPAPLPTSTPTETPTPLPTPTVTLTVPPTETAIPQPASLTGTIFLSSTGTKPFVSLVELREKETFNLIGKSRTNSGGIYKIENIDPGTYELWILISSKAAMISGCNDVAPPDDAWKIGIKFGDDKAMSMENAYLSKALLLMKNMPPSSDLKATGFFAVLEGFKIESGIENKMDVTLICK
jgi:hypothetical protein